MFNTKDEDFEFVMINPDNEEVYAVKNDPKYKENVDKLKKYYM